MQSMFRYALTALGDHYPSEAWAWNRSAASPPSNWHGNGHDLLRFEDLGTSAHASLFDLRWADSGLGYDSALRTCCGGMFGAGIRSRSVTTRSSADSSRMAFSFATGHLPRCSNFVFLGLLLLLRVDRPFPASGASYPSWAEPPSST